MSKRRGKELDAEVGLFGGMGLQNCKRIKKNGERCKNAPMKGQTVCHKHGGKAPQNLRKAQERIAAAAPGAAARIEFLSQFARSEYVRLQANQDILNRAGIGDLEETGIWTEAAPWEQVAAGLVEVTLSYDGYEDVIEGEVHDDESQKAIQPRPKTPFGNSGRALPHGEGP